MSVEFKPTSFRPSAGTKTRKVWEIADRLSKESGKKAKRKTVIEAYIKDGGNRNTASKQYDDWQREYVGKNSSEATTGALKLESVERRRLEIGADGRLLIPAEFREAMQSSPGETLSAWVHEGELHVVSRKVGIRKMQEMIQQHVPEGVSLVDELIKDRRAEAAKEEAELEEDVRASNEMHS